MENAAERLITTIIPTCERPETLRRAIESVLAQTMPHFKICIYDNSRDDRTEKMIKSLWGKDQRIEYWKHPTPIPAAQNFSFGLSRVHTPFFSFLADDDILLPNFYEQAISSLESTPNAQFFLGSTINISDRGLIRGIPANEWGDRQYYPSQEGIVPIIRHYINWTSAVFRRTVRDSIGDIDLDIKIIDFEYLLRAAALCPFIFSKTPCALFVEHSTSYSCNASLTLIWPGWKLIEEKILKIVSKNENLSTTFSQAMRACLQKHLRHFLIRAFLRHEAPEITAILQLYNSQSGRKKWHSFLIWISKNRIMHKCFSFVIKCRKKLIVLKNTVFNYGLYCFLKSQISMQLLHSAKNVRIYRTGEM